MVHLNPTPRGGLTGWADRLPLYGSMESMLAPNAALCGNQMQSYAAIQCNGMLPPFGDHQECNVSSTPEARG